MNKMWYKHTTEYYSALKRKKNLSNATTWMNPEDIVLNEARDKKTNTMVHRKRKNGMVVALGWRRAKLETKWKKSQFCKNFAVFHLEKFGEDCEDTGVVVLAGFFHTTLESKNRAEKWETVS